MVDSELEDGNSLPKRKPKSAAAERALHEADERKRLAQASSQAQASKEVGGRGGLDPARYGDWEVKGIASDF